MFLASPRIPTYRCPGEEHDIPRPVHLARLAAGYDHCRECPQREDSSTGKALDTGALESAVKPPGRRSLFTSEGVRGIHLNELTRSEAARIAGAFASCLWDEFEPSGDLVRALPSLPTHTNDQSTLPASPGEGITVLPTGRPGPIVVLANDDRPASPDLVMGVGVALRRMGCLVIDVGPVTRPCFWFAVQHLQAAGGVHVTGSGCDPAWTGMDFVRHGPLPCSRGADLDRIEACFRQGYTRPSRRPGSKRLYSATESYEAGFGRHFHALRPLRIALACPNRLLRDLLGRTFRKSACRLIPVETPTRARDLDDDRDPDVKRVSIAVREQEAHLGILIDDDAQRCVLFDDCGARAAPDRLLPLFAEHERETRRAALVVSEAIGEPGSANPTVRNPGDATRIADGATLSAMSLALKEPGAMCGGGASGRYWFVESFPTCDAVLTLVKLLQILSRSDRPFSEVLSRKSAAS